MRTTAIDGQSLPARDSDVPQEVVEGVLRAIRGIRYGSVEIIVHEGRVVQIERKEKVRLGQQGSGEHK